MKRQVRHGRDVGSPVHDAAFGRHERQYLARQNQNMNFKAN
jgi:hypothetical protein